MRIHLSVISLISCLGLLSCGGQGAATGQPDGADGGGDGRDGGNGADGQGSKFCVKDADCPGGQVCNPFSNRCAAPPPDGGSACQVDGDCPDGYWCAYGSCEQKVELPDLGEPCTLNCQDDLVCLSLWGEPPTCHQKCSGTAACPAQQHCIMIQGTSEGVCEKDCDIYTNDCPAGKTCLALKGGGYTCFVAGTAGVGASCNPSASDGCAPGLVCESNARKCADVCDPAGVRKECPVGKQCKQPSGVEFGVCS